MFSCNSCQTPLDKGGFNTGQFHTCPTCKRDSFVRVFPAAFRKMEPDENAPSKLLENDAGCFFHPSKKAAVACDSCGRFLCALCDIDMDGSHICFSCMESGHNSQKITTHETHRVMHDSLALKLSMLPVVTVIFFWLSLITAPVSLFIALKYWKKEKSIVPRGRHWRSVLTVVFSSAQIIAWSALFYYNFNT